MFADLVKQARSYRRFKESDPVSLETLKQLVDVARLAPSAGNKQPLRFRLVAGREGLEKVFPCLIWAALLKEWRGPVEGERPTGYIVLVSAADQGSPDWDLGIIGQTLQLAAAERGYGACMLGSIRREQLQDNLALPKNWAIRLVVAVGRPGETIVLEDVPAYDGPTAYYRTSDGAHHVPKRKLADLLV